MQSENRTSARSSSAIKLKFIRNYGTWLSVLFGALILVGGWILSTPAGAQDDQDQQVGRPHDHSEHDHSQLSLNDGSPPGEVVKTHHEEIPNPVFGSNVTVADRCQTGGQTCNWDDASTWRNGSVPGRNSLVIIDGNVQIRSERALAESIGIYPGGTLSFAQNTNTRLTTADLLVFTGGTLEIGTSNNPIAGNAQAEVVFRNLRFDERNDPTEILRGLVAPGGTIRVAGSPLSDTFLRTSVEPSRGATTITTNQSMASAGWGVGDSVLIPTSRQCVTAVGETCFSETEDRIITAISGNTATLNRALTYDHPGARDYRGQIDFMPHVINTSRNVIFRSEDPNGVRAHSLFHGRVDVDIRYAEFVDMGRTTIADLGSNNQKGRYPIHAHHLIGPQTAQSNGSQFTLIGNSVDFGEENVTGDHKWGISIHGSHYGLIEQNIVDNASGAAIVTESGSEAGNKIRENFAVRVVGGNEERTADPDPSDGTKSGRAGVGFWFNGGGRNSIRDNIAADVVECTFCFGIKVDNVFVGLQEVTFPNRQGEDPFTDGGESIPATHVGFNDFVNNEAYAVPNGMTVWWICATFETPHDNCSSNLDSFKVWHHHRWGYYGYETNNMTLDNFVVRGDEDALQYTFERTRGMEFSDYLQRNLLIKNADIQNVRTGMRLPTFRDERRATGPEDGFFTIEDSFIVSTEGLGLFAQHSVNGDPADLAAQTAIIRNVSYDFPRVVQPDVQRSHIFVSDESVLQNRSKSNFNLRNDVLVENYNSAPGAAGEDFYIIPGYQNASRCQSSIGNCGVSLTSRYNNVVNGFVFPLAGRNGPGGNDPGGNDPIVNSPRDNDLPVVGNPVQFGANLLENGNFDDDRSEWFRWSSDGSFQVNATNGEVQLIHTNRTGTNTSQFTQRIGQVNNGETLRLRFDVRSNQSNGTVGVFIQEARDPYARLTDLEEVQVNRTNRTVEVELSPNASAAEATFIFRLEDNAQTIWIDNVELARAGQGNGGNDNPRDNEQPVVENPVVQNPVVENPVVDPPAQFGTNRITNGNFDDDLSEWFRWSREDNFRASVTNGEARLIHNNLNGTNISQFSQRIGRVNNGETLRLRFDVRSNQSSGTVGVFVQEAKDPWTRLTNLEEIQVSPTNQTVEVELTPNASAAEATFIFRLEDNAQTIWIDNVELLAPGQGNDSPRDNDRPVVENPVFDPLAQVGSNRITNGDFDDDRSEWFRWSRDGSFQVNATNGEVQLIHTNRSGTNESQLTQRIGQVNIGDSFRVRFDVRSNQSNGTIGVLLQQAVEPWAQITEVQEVQVGRTTRTVEVVLTPNQTSTETTFMFQLEGDAQTIWIDNVELARFR